MVAPALVAALPALIQAGASMYGANKNKQAELSTRMMGDQLQLQNLQSLLNQILGRKATRQGMDMQQQLFDQYMQSQQGGIDWGALLGGAAGFALGGPMGAAAGYGIGKSF